MNKITKPIIVSALSALAFGTVGVAGTFALFTDQSQTTISAQAGIVDIGLQAGNLVTFSAEHNEASGNRVDENGKKYISKETTVQGTFTNLGTATLGLDGSLTLDRITPGDRVTFGVTFTNNTNVSYKYRLGYKAIGDDKTLARGITTTTNISGTTETYEGLLSAVTNWTYRSADQTAIAPLTFDIELPIDKGNEYQGKSISYQLYVEAVQGNAYTDDEEAGIEMFEGDDFETSAIASDGDTILTASNSEGTVSVKATIPAAATQVSSSDVVSLVVSEMTKKTGVSADTVALNFDVSLFVNGSQTTYFSKEVDVEIYVGTNLNISKITHKGTEIPSASYTYDAEEGLVRFSTQEFSPFQVFYTVPTRNTSYGFYDSFKVGTHWVHEITNKAEFQNIMTHINEAKEGADYTDVTLHDENTVYSILNDIDFGGDAYSDYAIATYHTVPFTGKLKGNNAKGQVKLSHIGAHTLSVSSATEKKFYGLFPECYKGEFTNIIIADSSINDSAAKPAGFVIGGVSGTNAEAEGTYLKFDNITIDEGCSINGLSGLGSLAGYARSIETVTLTNCENYASVTASSHSAAGFFGSLSTANNSGDRYFALENSTNYGDIKGGGIGHAAGFAAQAQGNSTIHMTMKNCANHGSINAGSGEFASPFYTFHGGNAETGVANDSVFLNNNNTGRVSKANTNAHIGCYGLTAKGESDSPILSNGNTVSRDQFFSEFVRASGAIKFNIIGQGDNPLDGSTIKLDLSSASAEFKASVHRIEIHTCLSMNNITYSTNTGSGAASGQPRIHTKVYDNITNCADYYSTNRLIYVGNTYPTGKSEPIAYENPSNPSGFRYDFEYNKIEVNDEHPRGYHELDDGTAYFIHDNTAVTAGTYNVTAKYPSSGWYEASIYDANGNLIGYADLVRDLYPSRTLLKISQIPSNVNIVG